MKTKNDPRHQKRRKIIKKLFSYSFSPPKDNQKALIKEKQVKTDSDRKIRKVLKNLKKIDNQISHAAPQFPIQQLNKIDLAILRLAIFELLLEKKEPVKVIIDEAIELSKEFGSEKSPQFVNGVLGTIIKKALVTNV